MKKENLRKYKDLTKAATDYKRNLKNPLGGRMNNVEQYNRNRPIADHIETQEELDNIVKDSPENDQTFIFERNSDTGEIFRRKFMEYDKRTRISFKDKKITREKVDHPNYYGGKDNPYEAIKVIEAWGLNFNLGNALKYISRAGKKENTKEDLKKASWYIKRELENL
jgi:hypothetical protein